MPTFGAGGAAALSVLKTRRAAKICIECKRLVVGQTFDATKERHEIFFDYISNIKQ